MGPLPTIAILVCTLLTTSVANVDARDKSGPLRASEMIGMAVEDTDGKKLGKIKDLVIDPEDGDVQYAVLSFGGFVGIGDKYFAVPWHALEMTPDNRGLALDVSKKDLKRAPGFDKNKWPDFSDPEETDAIYKYYGIPTPEEENLHSK